MTRFLNVISPAPRDTWWRIYLADRAAFVTQSPDWLDCICRTAGFEDASCLYELSDGRHMVLPLVRRRWMPQTVALRESLPEGWGIGGPIGSGIDDPHAIGAVLSDLKHRPSVSVRLRPNPLWAETWRAARHPDFVAIPRAIQAVDLHGGFSRVERRFHRSVREALRKADRAHLEVERDTTGRLVPEFSALFEKSVDRWAFQRHEPVLLARLRDRLRKSKLKFYTITGTMGDACIVYLARSEGNPAGAIMVLKGPNAQGVRTAMDKRLAAPTGAMYLLNYLAIRDAWEFGCGYFSMGESIAGSSAAKWKSHFGTTTFIYNEYRFERFPLTAIERSLKRGIKWGISRSSGG